MSVFDPLPFVLPDRDPSPPDPGPVPGDEQCAVSLCHEWAEFSCEECGKGLCDEHWIVVLDARYCQECAVKASEAA